MFKAVFTGHLDFGTQRSYEQALKMYQRRVENYYKADILLVEEDIFDLENLSLVIGKFTTPCSKRFWRNTYLLLDYVSQFAISGSFNVWLIEEGVVKKFIHIEPQGDRSPVVFYRAGNKLMKEGKTEEAIVAYTNSIGKFEKHSNAFENRGLAYEKLGDIDKAFADFKQATALRPFSTDAQFGLGRIHMDRDEYQLAIEAFQLAIKSSIPHQPIFWTARYKKGDSHAILGEWEKAAAEYKFFCYRNFTPDNPNFKHQRIAHMKWGKALMKLKDKEQDALKAFENVLKIEEIEKDGITVGEMRLWRGKARYQVGKKGFKEDWKVAKKAGLAEAAQLLAAHTR